MQGSLFDTGDAPTGAYGQPVEAPTVHNGDPASSLEADAEHRSSGKRAINKSLALALVKAWPDRTASELESLLRAAAPNSPLLATWELRRRLSDLARQTPPAIRVVGDRPSAVTGRREQVYRVA